MFNNQTIEEKAAVKIINLVNDFMADPRMMGYYLARVSPKGVAEQMAVMYESAQQEYARIEQDKKMREEYINGNTLF
jgi:hypothetical protein